MRAVALAWFLIYLLIMLAVFRKTGNPPRQKVVKNHDRREKEDRAAILLDFKEICWWA
jgi:hypothetical protein